jgi:multidrug efflux pump subunit AcrA (membrane-fusion protein)
MSDAGPAGPDALPEGEEQDPPGTRAMGGVRWALVALMAFAAAGAWSWYAAEPRVVAAETSYHCPMHPSIVTAQKGECPICGMDLVRVEPGAPGAVPEGAEKVAAPAPAKGSAALYTCPMHPAFVTPDASARCPDCGMKLVAKEGSPAAAAGASAPPAGLAPVELGAQRTQLAGVRTTAVARAVLSRKVRIPAVVAASENGLVSVTARFSGWVESVAAGQTGQPVRKGDVLATVFSPELVNPQQAYINAVRWSVRSAPGAVAVAVPGDLRRDAQVRLEQLGFAARDLEAIARSGQPQRAVNLRAPASGFVARKAAIRGLYVAAGAELFQIADLSTVWVLADVHEAEVGAVAAGQTASFEAAAYPGERIAGRVQFVYPALNPGTRTLQARIPLANRSLRLRPGMSGEVTIDLGASESLVAPRDAVVDTGEQQYVFVARGRGRLEPRRVKLGPSDGDRVAIVEGLREGEQVVAAASFLVDSESRVRAAVQGFEDAPGDPAQGR